MPARSSPTKVAGTRAAGGAWVRVLFSRGGSAAEREAAVVAVVKGQVSGEVFVDEGREGGAVGGGDSGWLGQKEKEQGCDIGGGGGPFVIPAYDHPDIILGQGTVARELEAQVRDLLAEEVKPKEKAKVKAEANPASPTSSPPSPPSPPLHAVITPLGGGGLNSGVTAHFSDSSTLVYGAEPWLDGADDGARALARLYPSPGPGSGSSINDGTTHHHHHHNSTTISSSSSSSFSTAAAAPPHIPSPATRAAARIASLQPASRTIADGLRTPVGVLPWLLISDRRLQAGVFAVSEAQIRAALRVVVEEKEEEKGLLPRGQGLGLGLDALVEPSAMVGLAVALFSTGWRAEVAMRQRREAEEKGEDGVWRVGVVLSGGNVTAEGLRALLA